MRTLLAPLLCALLLPSAARAIVTPFGQRVNRAIDRALGNLRGVEVNGNIGGRSTGLAVLCFLERRESADWGAPPVGYAGMAAADQALVRRAIAYMINNDVGLGPGGTPYTYQTGSSVMALALFLDTGGPDAVGAQRGAAAALQLGVANLVRIQNVSGGWNYGAPSGDNDLSTTQFALAALAAASAVVPVDRDVITRAAASTDAHHEGAGCYAYRTNGWAGCSSSMTASALWVQRLGERAPNHANVQRSLRWLRDNWRFDGHVAAPQAAWGSNSYYYYLWAVAKGLEVTGGEDANLVLADDVGGARDPAADQYPAEPRSWYYDIAYSLTQRQLGAGNWPSGGNRSCWPDEDGEVSCTAFATLVLLRSLGGVCIDQDGDEVEFGGAAGECLEDNCPEIPNPRQIDGDDDGVGDACDPCVPVAEICNGADDDCDGEVDEGEPGAGVACDSGDAGECAAGESACVGGAVACLPLREAGVEACDGLDNDCDGATDEGLPAGEACDTGEPGACGAGVLVCVGGAVVCRPGVQPAAEVCDGLDNDCDGAVDDDVAGEGEPCATGAPGACADGHRVCLGGEIECEPDAEPSDEVCNVVDDDCDGTVDEGQRNACGRCGETPVEVCDGVDDDCDGEVDDEAPCPGAQVCRWGRCLDPCQNNECGGLEVCVEGLCAEACEVVECPEGLRCEAGECVDPCAGVGCGAGEICAAGECVPNNCFATGCPEDERCVEFVCEPDPCAEQACEAGTFCREGLCVGSCAELSCPRGERCVDGACVAHDCAGVICEDGICAAGDCVEDPCDGVECLDGEGCDEAGECVGDPCLHIECPPAERCEVVDGQAQCMPDWDPEGAPPDPIEVPDAAEADAGELDAFVEPGAVLVDGGVAGGDAMNGGGTTPDAGSCNCDGTGAPFALWTLLLAVRRRRAS